MVKLKINKKGEKGKTKKRELVLSKPNKRTVMHDTIINYTIVVATKAKL